MSNSCRCISSNHVFNAGPRWSMKWLKSPPPPRVLVMIGPVKAQRRPSPDVTVLSNEVRARHAYSIKRVILTKVFSGHNSSRDEAICFSTNSGLKPVRDKPRCLLLDKHRIFAQAAVELERSCHIRITRSLVGNYLHQGH